MNTKKVVFQKLFSQEAKKAQKLSKQRKISLSLMQKMEGYLDMVKEDIVDASDRVDEGIVLAKDLESKYAEGVDLIERLKNYVYVVSVTEKDVTNLLEQYRNAAEDLGINPEDNDTYFALSEILNGALADSLAETEKAIYDLEQYIK